MSRLQLAPPFILALLTCSLSLPHTSLNPPKHIYISILLYNTTQKIIFIAPRKHKSCKKEKMHTISSSSSRYIIDYVHKFFFILCFIHHPIAIFIYSHCHTADVADINVAKAFMKKVGTVLLCWILFLYGSLQRGTWINSSCLEAIINNLKCMHI